MRGTPWTRRNGQGGAAEPGDRPPSPAPRCRASRCAALAGAVLWCVCACAYGRCGRRMAGSQPRHAEDRGRRRGRTCFGAAGEADRAVAPGASEPPARQRAVVQRGVARYRVVSWGTGPVVRSSSPTLLRRLSPGKTTTDGRRGHAERLIGSIDALKRTVLSRDCHPACGVSPVDEGALPSPFPPRPIRFRVVVVFFFL